MLRARGMNRESKIYVAGHRGMVGSAVVRRLHDAGFFRIVTRSSAELDLTRQAEVEAFFEAERPDVVVMTAARTGGILANSRYPAAFLLDNLAIATNTIHAAFRAGVGRFLFLGSSCIYPKLAPQPLTEDLLLSGFLEPTNEGYAVAKIAGVKLCQLFRRQHGVLFHSLVPTNLYGAGDNYHPENAHLLPALLRRCHEARRSGAAEVTLWGTGSPLREMMHADDLADAVLFSLLLDDPPDVLNVGTGVEHSVRQIAGMVAATVGFSGRLVLDPSRPDGTPRKLLDVSRLKALGWSARIPLEQGIPLAHASFLREEAAGALRER